MTPRNNVRCAWLSTGLAFALTGLTFATWAARVPEIKDRAGASEGDLAIVFAVLNAGAIIGLQLARYPLARWGARRVLPCALVAFGLSVALPALVTSVPVLCLAVGVFALLNSVVDVAMNARAVEVEQRSGRKLLSRCHAMHSLGMIGGSLGGLVATHTGAPVLLHFGLVAVLVAGGTAGTVGTGVPEGSRGAPSTATTTEAPGRGGWTTAVVIVGLLGFCVTFAEGAANDWVAVFLRDAAGASATVASGGVGVFAASLLAGRLVGDHVVARLGAVRAFRAGTLLGAAGFGLSLLHPHPVLSLVGVTALGLGISYTLPVALRIAASSAPDERVAGTAVARASTLAYLGSFVGPLVIGPVAASSTLSTGLGVAAGVVALACAGAGGLRIAEHRSRTTGDVERR